MKLPSKGKLAEAPPTVFTVNISSLVFVSSLMKLLLSLGCAAREARVPVAPFLICFPLKKTEACLWE